MRVAGRMIAGKRVAIALVFTLILAGLITTSQATGAATVVVSMQNFSFTGPNGTNQTTVVVGTTVQWQNTGGTHTTTSDAVPPVWDSGTLTTGQTFSFTFNQVGVFPYHCTFHRGLGMVGTITVVPPPGPADVAPNFGGTGGGNSVTITGTDFEANATVMFGSAMATNVVVNSTTITALTPPNAAGTVDITVTNPSGGVGTLSQSFTYAVVNALPAVQVPGSSSVSNPAPLPDSRKPDGPPASNPNPLPVRERLTGGAAGGSTVNAPTATAVPAPLPLPPRR